MEMNMAEFLLKNRIMKRARSFRITSSPYKRFKTGTPQKRYARPIRSNYVNLVAARPYRTNAPELKVADIPVATYQVNTTGSFTLLAKPQIGSDFDARIGRKIMLNSFYIRGYVGSEASVTSVPVAAFTAQQGRMIIFADMQPNGATPVVGDLLNTASPASHLNLNNRDRFKIICDKTFVVDPYIYSTTATQAVASTSRQIFQIKKFKKIALEMVFNGTNGGTIADITSGALYMFWIGSNGAGTATDMNAVLGTRVRYSDTQ